MDTTITAMNSNLSPSMDLRMLANTVRHKTQERFTGGRRSKSIAMNNLLTNSHFKQPPGTAMIPNLQLNDFAFSSKHPQQPFPKSSFNYHQRFVNDSMMQPAGLDLKDFIKRNIHMGKDTKISHE
jgi:hypothetical protein